MLDIDRPEANDDRFSVPLVRHLIDTVASRGVPDQFEYQQTQEFTEKHTDGLDTGESARLCERLVYLEKWMFEGFRFAGSIAKASFLSETFIDGVRERAGTPVHAYLSAHFVDRVLMLPVTNMRPARKNWYGVKPMLIFKGEEKDESGISVSSMTVLDYN